EGKISRSCATQPRPLWARRWGATKVMSAPRHVIWPRPTSAKPMMVSRRVDFPTPLRPSTARRPCSGTSNEMSSSTTASPYPERTFLSASSGSAMARSAEIHLAHARIGGDPVRLALHQDPAAGHADDPAREPEHHVHVLREAKPGQCGGQSC